MNRMDDQKHDHFEWKKGNAYDEIIMLIEFYLMLKERVVQINIKSMRKGDICFSPLHRIC